MSLVATAHRGKVNNDTYLYWERQRVRYPNSIAYWILDEAAGTTALSKMVRTGNLVYNPSFEYLGAGGADVYANWNDVAGDGAIADSAARS